MIRRFCSLLVVALLASSCAPDTSAEPAGVAFSDEPVQLTVWTWDGVFSPALVADFERENPDIRVDIRTSSFDQHHTGLENALAEDGALPDVVAIERSYLPDFQTFSTDFADLGEFGADEIASDFLEWRWDEGVANDGRIIALPTDVGGLALAYRRDLFDEAGLPSDPEDVEALLQTWDDFLVLGERFMDADTGAGFIDSGDSIYRVRLGQEPFAYVDDAGEPVLDESVAVAWDFVVEAIELNLTADFAQFSPEWTAGFADKSFATIAAPSWMRGQIANFAPETASMWAIVPVPGTGGNWGGSQLAIPEAGLHSEEAWRFIEFMTSPETQLEIFRETGNFPSTPELYSKPEIIDLQDDFFGGQNVGRIYVESVQALPSQPTTPGQRDLDRLFGESISAVQLGEDSDARWDLAIEQVAQIFEDNEN